MDEIQPPTDLTCPISKDLMNDPTTVTHHGVDYTFDRVCFETWKTTPGGDQNPLTMLDGFRVAPYKSNNEMKVRVCAFKKEHGLDVNGETEEIKLEPFSDYQQIQDDEAEAYRLDMELNGPPLPASRVLAVRWIGENGRIEERELTVSPLICLMYDRLPEMRQVLMNMLVGRAMGLPIDMVSDGDGDRSDHRDDAWQGGVGTGGTLDLTPDPEIHPEDPASPTIHPEDDVPVEPEPVKERTPSEPVACRFAGMQSGFLNRP